MATDWSPIIAQVIATLAAAGIAFWAADRSARLAVRQASLAQGRQYVIVLRAEVRSIRSLLKRVLEHPHPATEAPGGLRYELDYFGEPLKYAPVYLSMDHQFASVSDDTLERVTVFYSSLLHLRSEAMAMGGAIFYPYKADLVMLIELADRAIEELEKERLKQSGKD